MLPYAGKGNNAAEAHTNMNTYERQLLVEEIAERAAAKTKGFVEAAAEALAVCIRSSDRDFETRLASMILVVAAVSLFLHSLGQLAQFAGVAIFVAWLVVLRRWATKKKASAAKNDRIGTKDDLRLKLYSLLAHLDQLQAGKLEEKREEELEEMKILAMLQHGPDERLFEKLDEILKNKRDDEDFDAGTAREAAQDVLFPMLSMTRTWTCNERGELEDSGMRPSVSFPIPVARVLQEQRDQHKIQIEALYKKYFKKDA